MATGDQAVRCVDPSISLEELIASALVQAATGEIGLRAYTLTKAAADIEAYPGCSDPSLTNPEDILRNAFGITPAGKTAIIFIQEA